MPAKKKKAKKKLSKTAAAKLLPRAALEYEKSTYPFGVYAGTDVVELRFGDLISKEEPRELTLKEIIDRVTRFEATFAAIRIRGRIPSLIDDIVSHLSREGLQLIIETDGVNPFSRLRSAKHLIMIPARNVIPNIHVVDELILIDDDEHPIDFQDMVLHTRLVKAASYRVIATNGRAELMEAQAEIVNSSGASWEVEIGSSEQR
jgi:hypothetical protein